MWLQRAYACADIRTDLAVGYDNLYLRDKKIAFTYQMDEKTTYEICEYDSVSNKYYYLLPLFNNS